MFSWWSISLMGVLIVIAVVAMVLRSRTEQPVPDNDAPLDILERRYAEGEIDRAGYEQRKRDLAG